MKKKILFGVIFSLCIIMLVNTSSAVEYRSVNKYNTNLLKLEILHIDIFIEKIRQIIGDLNVKSIDLKSTKELEELSNDLSKLKFSYINNPNLPTILGNIPSFILGLILSLIGTVIGIIYGKIFGPLTVLLIKILTAPAILFAKIIEFICKLLTP